MKIAILGAIALGLTATQSVQGAECLNVYQIAQQGPFPEDNYKLPDGNVVKVTITDFWTNASPPLTANGFSEVVPQGCFDGPMALRLGNKSLTVAIAKNVTDVQTINVNFCDYGGYENVSARDAAPADFIDDVRSINGRTLPNHDGSDVDMSLRMGDTIQNSGGATIGYQAKLIFRAKEPLQTVTFGGQEVFVHSVCFGK